MALTGREIETLRVKAWKARAKGKGIRWRMIRDTMSVVSASWMTLSEVQDCMVRIWGLTKNKTREILEEMVGLGDCLLEMDEDTGEMIYHLATKRVTFWLGPKGLEAIPAGIVEAVVITRDAHKLERDRRIPGGPSA